MKVIWSFAFASFQKILVRLQRVYCQPSKSDSFEKMGFSASDGQAWLKFHLQPFAVCHLMGRRRIQRKKALCLMQLITRGSGFRLTLTLLRLGILAHTLQMSKAVAIQSVDQFQSLLSSSKAVVADCKRFALCISQALTTRSLRRLVGKDSTLQQLVLTAAQVPAMQTN